MGTLARLLLTAVTASACMLPMQAWAACLQHPLNGKGRVTSVPSMRFHPTLKVMRWHKGLDIGVAAGTPIVAAEAGVVRAAFQSPGAGIYVAITGSMGQTKYFHMSKRAANVTQGTQVSAGQVIGYVGMTGGISTGPHLHFEVWRGGSFERNPLSLLCGGNSAPPPPQSDEDVHDAGQGVSEAEAEALGGPAPTGPDMSSWDDVSTRELIANEVNRRFMNNEWLEQQAKMGKKPLMMEYTHMLALRTYLRERIRRQRENIEVLAAARQARNNADEMRVRLERQRQAAAKAK